MRHTVLFAAIALAVLGSAGTSEALAAKSKAGHKFKGNVDIQYRTNTNVSAAPASNDGFDFAELSDFGIDDDDAVGADEDSEDDSDDDGFDDLVDVDPSEDEIEQDDAIDEDGDGIDDLLDPNADNIVDSESRFTTKLGLAHKYTFANEGTSWNNAVRFANDAHNQRDDLDKFNWAVTSGFEFAPKGSKHRFKPSLSYVTLEKDSNKFSSTFVLSLGYNFEVSKRLSLGVTYNYQDKDVTSPSAPDARVDTLALSADFKASDNDIFKIKYAPKVEDSTKVTRNSDASGREITYTRKLLWDMTIGLGYKFDSIEFVNLQPKRKDDNETWALEVSKEFGKKFSIELGYETRDRQSNIPSKDASNDSSYLGFGWKF